MDKLIASNGSDVIFDETDYYKIISFSDEQGWDIVEWPFQEIDKLIIWLKRLRDAEKEKYT